MYSSSANASVERITLKSIDDFYIELLVICERAELFDFWPTISCPGVVTTDLPDKHKLFIGGKQVSNTKIDFLEFYYDPYCFEPGHFLCKRGYPAAMESAREKAYRMHIYRNKGSPNFERLYKDQFVMLDGERLSYEIRSEIDERRQKLSNIFEESVRNDQKIILMYFLGIVIGLIILGLILVRVARFTTRVAKDNFPKILEKFNQSKTSVQVSRARKIVEEATLDEAARVSTRAAMTVFNEKEISTLQIQINNAIERGDYEVAQTLMSTMRKITNK
jgi:hypothetical protein